MERRSSCKITLGAKEKDMLAGYKTYATADAAVVVVAFARNGVK
jgi:hypothetical protein